VSKPVIGVVIVVYNSADVILDCLESLFSQQGLELRVVVVDNASPDDSVERLRAWAKGTEPWAAPADSPLGPAAPARKPIALAERGPGAAGGALAPLTILHAPRNLGYAGGVNLGLELLAADKGVELLWILNPDCLAPPETIPALLAHQRACGPFSIMGGRIVYCANRRIHADGGRVRRWSGVCESVNRGADASLTPLPDPAGLDYIIGAHMVVSRAFLEQSGPMVDDYFLYYEEVDWAFRRGPLPLALAPGAVVYHHGGTSIGTAQLDARPTGFANYFNYRNRMRFVRRFHPWRLPTTYLLSLARIVKALPVDDRDRIVGALRGLHGMAPPRFVAERVGPEAAPLAFGAGTAA
jgi:GT2 family glycosyltransferase